MTVTLETPEFVTWLKGINNKNLQHMSQNFPSLAVPAIHANDGRRYIKVIRSDSVHAFIDKTNGDVLKPATWRAPAKHARGNIFHEDNGQGCMGPYGPAYLRG
jgi:hypothetical protein